MDPAAVSLVKDVVNIAFFLVVGGVTWFTYRKARRTVLQPIRTEIFKQQLELLSGVLKLFVGKHEQELRQDYGLPQTLRANVILQADLFAQRRFGGVIDETSKPYRLAECPVAFLRVGPDTHSLLETSDGLVLGVKSTTAERAPLSGIRVHKQYAAMDKQVKEILESPLLPKRLVELLRQYRETARANFDVIKDVVDEYVDVLPDTYESVQAMAGKDLTKWSWNRVNERSVKLKPQAEEIVAYVRSYFDIEKLLEA